MKAETTRREFLKETALIGAAVTALRAADGAEGAETAPGELPKIKLGTLEVSRLILGSNPFFGFDHGNPQASSKEMRDYYSEQRIMAVMDEAAGHGITAVWTPAYAHWIRLWNKYQEKGGKLRIWIGQPDPSPELMKDHIAAAAKNGAEAVCVQGERVDQQFRAGRFDVLREWLDQIHSFNLPAGLASHRPDVHLKVEEKGLPTNFYHQCFFQPENYSKEVRDLAVAAIRQIEKPVVGYKVLAAGRLPAEEAFSFAFKHLRPKDGICVGVFPKNRPHQVAENAALTRNLDRRRVARSPTAG